MLLTDSLCIFGMMDDHEVINLNFVEPRVDQGQAEIPLALKRLYESLNKQMACAKHTTLKVSLTRDRFVANT